MERDALLYKIRRKGQVLAHRILPDEVLSKIYYKVDLKEKLSFDNPQTFNEKLQWMKLYYYPKNPKVVIGADKYAVREYIKEKQLGDLLTPLIGVWDDARQIDWEKLPEQFVLKCNHGCAYNLICEDKKTFDKDAASKQLNGWLKEDFGAFNLEIHYSEIRHHRIICEEYLGASITDYKFFCFNGDPKFYYVSEDLIHDRQAKIGFFNIDGSKLPMKREEYADLDNVERPTFFEAMKESAKVLSRDFPFVRVDFFVTSERYYFAELTFTPGGCMMVFNPKSYDLEWGQLLDISFLVKK